MLYKKKLIIFILLNITSLIYSKFIDESPANEIAVNIVQKNMPSISQETKKNIIRDALNYAFYPSLQYRDKYLEEQLKLFLQILSNLNTYTKQQLKLYNYELKDDNQLYYTNSKALLHLLLIRELQNTKFDQQTDFSRIQSALFQGYNKKEDNFDLPKVFNDINRRFENTKTTWQLLDLVKKERLKLTEKLSEISVSENKLINSLKQQRSQANIKIEIQKFITELSILIKKYIELKQIHFPALPFITKEIIYLENFNLLIAQFQAYIDKSSLFNNVINIDEILKEFTEYANELKKTQDVKSFDDNVSKLIEKIKIKTPEILEKYIKEFPNLTSNPNEKDANQFTALHVAATNGDLEGAKELIKLGTNVNAIGVHNITPLMQAAYYDKDNIVKLLLENNADTTLKTSNTGQTALDVARAQNNQKTVALLERT